MNAPRLTAAPPSGFRRLLARLKTHLTLKQWSLTLGLTAFFIAYFTILRHPLFPVITVPFTALDRWIGFQPVMLIPYVSLWVYVSVLPSLYTTRRELLGWFLAATVLSVAGLGMFFFWPTIIPPVDIDWARHSSVAFLKAVDATGNACPSLHAGFAVFTLIGFARLLAQWRARWWLQAVNALWGLAIVYSTVAIKQHVALDALSGSLLGAAVALAALSLRVTSRPLLWGAVGAGKLCALALWLSGLPAGLALAVFFSGGAWMIYHLLAPSAQGLVRVFTRFETPVPAVWLTIDDGPHPDDTPRLLDLLARHQARVTFFLVGERAARHPELVAAILRHGHDIGHHTHTHPLADFWCASRARTEAELDATLAVLARAGTRPQFYRSPVGIKTLFLGRALSARGLSCIGWTLRSGDSFARDPAQVARQVMKYVRPGAIVLLHEGPPVPDRVRVEGIRLTLEALAARGYRCVVPPLAALR